MTERTQGKYKPRYVNNTLPSVLAPAHQPTIPAMAPAPEPRPMPVYAICGHLGKSKYHTCGSYNCEKIYGYGW